MELENIKKILVRGPNWIGDAVMCTPALAGLRAAFPRAEITLLANRNIGELLRENPAVDHIRIDDRSGRHSGLSGKMRLARELAAGSYELAVLFQNAFGAALLAWLARIPHRYGYPTDGRAPLLTIRAPRPEGKCHQIDYYLHLLRPLGIGGSPRALFLQTTESEDQEAGKILADSGIRQGTRIAGINPGATYGSAKQWSVERFAHVADRLIEAHQMEVLMFGGPGEEALGADISGRMKGRAVVMSGRLTIRELMALIKQCSLFITNDSGPMHIAAAFGIPLIAVFGPTDPEETSPTGEHSVMVRKAVECSPCLLRRCPIDHRCMTRITAEEVYETAKRLLVKDASGAAIGEPVH